MKCKICGATNVYNDEFHNYWNHRDVYYKKPKVGRKPMTVLIGSRNEHCEQYAIRNGLKKKDVRIITSYEQMRGLRCEEVFCVYEYWKIKDWYEAYLYLQSRGIKINRVDY